MPKESHNEYLTDLKHNRQCKNLIQLNIYNYYVLKFCQMKLLEAKIIELLHYFSQLIRYILDVQNIFDLKQQLFILLNIVSLRASFQFCE